MSPRLVLIRNDDTPVDARNRRPENTTTQPGAQARAEDTGSESRRELDQLWWWAGI